MKPIIYFSAGLNRSASTWLYNAMRLMLEVIHPGQVYGSLPGIYDASDPHQVHLMKVHQANEGVGMKSVFTACSHRDLVAILRSLNRMGWAKLDEANALYMMHRIVADHTYWSSRADFEFAYEDFIENQGRTLRGLHAAMKLNLPEAELARIEAELKTIAETDVTLKDHEYFDPVNFLHRHHVSRADTVQPVISPQLEQAVRATFADWFTRYGYAPMTKAA